MTSHKSIFKQFNELKERTKLTEVPEKPLPKRKRNGLQICSRCGETKPMNKFPLTLSGKHRSSQCKECTLKSYERRQPEVVKLPDGRNMGNGNMKAKEMTNEYKKKVLNAFEKTIKPYLKEHNWATVDKLNPLVTVAKPTLYLYMDILVDEGLVEVIKRNRRNYYYLAGDPMPTIGKTQQKEKPVKQPTKKDKEKSTSFIKDALNSIFPALYSDARKFSVLPKQEVLEIDFKNQSNMLNLYDALPNNLKEYEGLRMTSDPVAETYQIKLSLAWEAGK